MTSYSKRLYVLGAAIAVTNASASAQTTWLGTNSAATAYYGGALVNFKNQSSSDLLLTGLFDLNLSGSGGFSNDYQVYWKNSALAGSELDPSTWTLLGSSSVTTNAQGSYTTINVGNTVQVGAGQTIGLAFFVASAGATGGYMGYRSGANTYSDGTAQITTGMAKGYRDGFSSTTDQLFNVDTFNPRTWSGRVQYAPVPEPASMIALGMGGLSLLRRKRK